VFTGENGRSIWRGIFSKLVKWSDAVTAIGVRAARRKPGKRRPQGSGKTEKAAAEVRFALSNLS
jgi:hypothetical protein